MQVPSLGWEDPLEEEITPDSNIFAWEIPYTEEASGHGVSKSQTGFSS